MLHEQTSRGGGRREHVHADVVRRVLDRGLLAEVHERALARAVHGVSGRHDEPEGRAHRDDRAAAAFDHVRDRRAHAQERPFEVHVEHVLPLVVGEVDERHHALDRGREHEHPDAAQARSLSDHGLDVGCLGHIARDGHGVLAVGNDRIRDDLGRGPIDVGNDHGRTV